MLCAQYIISMIAVMIMCFLDYTRVRRLAPAHRLALAQTHVPTEDSQTAKQKGKQIFHTTLSRR